MCKEKKSPRDTRLSFSKELQEEKNATTLKALSQSIRLINTYVFFPLEDGFILSLANIQLILTNQIHDNNTKKEQLRENFQQRIKWARLVHWTEKKNVMTSTMTRRIQK